MPLYLLICVLLILTAIPLLPLAEGGYDLWWQLQLGASILNTGEIKIQETLGVCGIKEVWVNHEWLSQVVLVFSENSWGPSGPGKLRALLVVAIVFVQFLLLRIKNTSSFGSLCLLVLLLNPILMHFANVRPQTFGLLFLSLEFLLLEALKLQEIEGRKNAFMTAILLLILVLILALWINMHGSAVLGFLILPIYACSFSSLWLRGGCHCMLLLIFAQPWRAQYLWYILEELSAEHRHIGEWSSLDGVQWFVWGLFIFLLGIGVKTADAISTSRVVKRITIEPLFLIGIALCFATARHNRMLPFFALTCVSFAAWRLDQLFTALPRWLRTAGAWVVCVGIVLFAIRPILAIARYGVVLSTEGQKLPRDAAEWINQNRNAIGSLNLLVPLEWGGFVTAKVPNSKVAIDGRNVTAYRNEYVEGYLSAYVQGDLLKLRSLCPGAQLLLIPPSSRLAHDARVPKVLLYEDPAAKLYSLGDKG